MGYGSNQGVEDANADYREACAGVIARGAAELVAARDMERQDAIDAMTEWVRRNSEALNNATGMIAVENRYPSPSKAVPPAQALVIARELLELARNAADTL